MGMYDKIVGFAKGLFPKNEKVVKHTVLDAISEGRSPRWPSVRAAFLKDHPKCECCGGETKLNVHHIVPFHVDQSKEEDMTNLITLCEGSRGLNCHLWIGHCGNWRAWNESVRETAVSFQQTLSKRLGVKW